MEYTLHVKIHLLIHLLVPISFLHIGGKHWKRLCVGCTTNLRDEEFDSISGGRHNFIQPDPEILYLCHAQDMTSSRGSHNPRYYIPVTTKLWHPEAATTKLWLIHPEIATAKLWRGIQMIVWSYYIKGCLQTWEQNCYIFYFFINWLHYNVYEIAFFICNIVFRRFYHCLELQVKTW